MKSNASYLARINPKIGDSMLADLRRDALARSIPIVTDEGLAFLDHVVKLSDAETLLEIGTAIGYSAIALALNNPSLNIVSIERDAKLADEARLNIERANLSERITVLVGDAHTIESPQLRRSFDMLFIDAAKSQLLAMFERYEPTINPRGVFVVDNVLFRDMMDSPPENKNLRALVKKIDRFNQAIVHRDDYTVYIYPIGDGMALGHKKG